MVDSKLPFVGWGGVLMSLLRCLKWVYARTLEGVVGSSLAILDYRWEMTPLLVSGIICGVGIWLLKDTFPDLLGIACAKDASVVVHLEFSGGFTQWNLSFARVAYD